MSEMQVRGSERDGTPPNAPYKLSQREDRFCWVRRLPVGENSERRARKSLGSSARSFRRAKKAARRSRNVFAAILPASPPLCPTDPGLGALEAAS